MQYCASTAVKQTPYSKHCLGLSFEGRPIHASANFDIQSEKSSTLLLGGMHGDEPATCVLLEMFVGKHRHLPPTLAIPSLNPDGAHRQWRYNARSVDLNRNFDANWSASSEEPSGPCPWSEPETCLLRDLILKLQPSKIVSLHWALGELDADGPQSWALAQAMWAALDGKQKRPYRLRTNGISKTTDCCPGSLGQWCGYSLKYPDGRTPAIVTLELPHAPDDLRAHPLPADHLEQLHAWWQRDPRSYIQAVAPAVDRMLLSACFH